MIKYDEATKIIKELKSIIIYKLKPVGGYRRKKESMKDIDLITTTTLDHVSQKLEEAKIVDTIVDNKRRKLTFYYNGTQIDIFYVKAGEWYYALLHYTGDKNFNIHMRRHANLEGYKLNQYGLFHKDSNRRVKSSKDVKSEKDIFDLVDFKYHKPEDRIGDKIKIKITE